MAKLVLTLSVTLLASASIVFAAAPPSASTDKPKLDLTKVVVKDTKKNFHLGPIGIRGWMHIESVRLAPQDYTWDQSTASARQVLVTKVEKGSPADGQLEVGDVILGIGDMPFDSDPRMALAAATNEAEKTENKGALKLMRWRPNEVKEKEKPKKEGKKKDSATEKKKGEDDEKVEAVVLRPPGTVETVTLTLKTLGSYSDTAPYDCPKSEALYKQTLEAVLRDEGTGKLGIGALAMMATGEPACIDKAKGYVTSIKKPDLSPGFKVVEKGHAWNWGYQLIALGEYHFLTGDESVLPTIQDLSVALSMGQSNNGTWGHHMAQPSYNNGRTHSRLSGYAALCQPSLTCYMGLVLAQKAGAKHPELTQALKACDEFFGHYVDKGAVPYGYGEPLEYTLTNNGTSGTAALTFAIKGDKKGAAFFSKLCTPAGTKVEIGHTGAFFNSMWTGLGANLAGPKAYAGYFKDWTPLRTLTRKWNGGYVYQNAGGGANGYRGLPASAAMLLHLSLPKRTLFITGKGQDESLWLNDAEAKEIVTLRRIDYVGKSVDELIDLLGHEMPLVRRRSADELGTREGEFVDKLQKLLKGTRHQKIGASHAIARLKEKAAPTMDDLLLIVRDKTEELWVRNRAVDALSRLGEPARKHLPELLKMLVEDIKEDQRRHFELSLAWAVTNLAEKPYHETQDKTLIFAAAKKLLGHPRMRARTEGMKLIQNIGLEDLTVFADQVVHVIRNQDPSYATYHQDRPSKYGLKLFDRLNVKEGMDLCADTFWPGIWGQKYRIGGKSGRLEQMKAYGAAAKYLIPKLKELKIKGMEEVIASIESSKVERTFITLEDVKAAGKPK